MSILPHLFFFFNFIAFSSLWLAGGKEIKQIRCFISCSTSETGGEEAAGGEQQGEGAQEKEGEVRREGKSTM